MLVQRCLPGHGGAEGGDRTHTPPKGQRILSALPTQSEHPGLYRAIGRYHLTGNLDIPRYTGASRTFPGNRYRSWNGTSMATPHVSGLAALLFSQDYWHRTNYKVRYILQATARDLGARGRDTIFGYGRIDAWRAVNYRSP